MREAQVADPESRFARAYVHAGMVALDGEKMSKSKGNLVFVSRLRADHVVACDGSRSTNRSRWRSGNPIRAP